MLEKLLKQTSFAPILKEVADQYVWIDLSKFNAELLKVDVTDTGSFSTYIQEYLTLHNAKVAIGGYQEHRNIYKRSAVFNNDPSEERFIHLGIDLWTSAYTPIHAPLKGVVHSFKNNKGLGNYGPTIILEHQLKKQVFYTLYGHLTKDSLDHLMVGEKIDKGEMFGAIGNHPSNGDYPPHLHFQIIKDLGGLNGDFPGVTSLNNLKKDLQNSLDPNLILKIKKDNP